MKQHFTKGELVFKLILTLIGFIMLAWIDLRLPVAIFLVLFTVKGITQ